jgi:YfiH family protein
MIKLPDLTVESGSGQPGFREPGFGQPGFGAVFSEAADGDLRHDHSARVRLAAALGISPEWATVTQVHGTAVVRADGPGNHGPADALHTTVRGLPLAVFTADCAGVVLVGEGAVGVAHAGWRGAAAGVVAGLASAMRTGGHAVTRAAIGPAIGPCCYEVGEEVAGHFVGACSTTTWDTTSVDLAEAVRHQLPGVEVWSAGHCTRHEAGWYSHRRDRTAARMATVVWLP